jgi:hypothetical protein
MRFGLEDRSLPFPAQRCAAALLALAVAAGLGASAACSSAEAPAREPARPAAAASPAPPPASAPGTSAAPAPAGAPPASAASPAEEALRARVTEYWQARTKLNLAASYAFYEPAFRKTYPQDQFLLTFRRLLRFAPQFQGIEAVELQPDGKSAKVKVKLRTTPDVLEGRELISVSEETWRLIDGTWWRQGESLLPNI